MLVLSALLGLAALSSAQTVPNTYPHNYTGIPNGTYSPEWQNYFEVTLPLPNVTWALPRSFAGNIAVDRPGHPNDTLFFWGVEKTNGSLTASPGENDDEPWLIWLNGGPGASSFLGFMAENGPLHVTNTYSIVANNYSWNQQVDAIWIDQPVGTGYSTADTTGYIANEDQMGQDFLGFLSNLVKVFPSLAKRPLYLTGESYAGTYIPYITKAIFSTPKPPVNLRKFAIGDGAIGSLATFEELPALTLIETYPQLINFDDEVYEYFKTQEHLCGYDLNFTYPQNGHFVSLVDPFTTTTSAGTECGTGAALLAGSSKSWRAAIAEGFAAKNPNGLTKRDLEDREDKRLAWKRDLTGRANGTLDPYYGCFLWDEVVDYAVNFSFPWTLGGFDAYDIPDALNPEAPLDPSVFLNDNRTRSALHAPTSKDWEEEFSYPFGSTYNHTNATWANEFCDPSVEPMAFLSELATNASERHVAMIFYSGNDDSLVGHRGTQAIIQNMTFGGIQGFTRKPSTPWYDDLGTLAGIVHQERNLSYVLVLGAGHEVPEYQPERAYVLLREFILGSNSTGLVVNNSTAIGGENTSLAGDIIPGGNVIFYGSGTTTASVTGPSASVASWASFLATATVAP